jgi:plasmid stabilization system protein ParE
VNPPVLRPAAAADVEEAWLWYEAQREGLGDEFLQVVQEAIESIGTFPESAPPVRPDILRQLLKRFPYGSVSICWRGSGTALASRRPTCR